MKRRIKVGLRPYSSDVDTKKSNDINGFGKVGFCTICRKEPTNNRGNYCPSCEATKNRIDSTHQKYPRNVVRSMIINLQKSRGIEVYYPVKEMF